MVVQGLVIVGSVPIRLRLWALILVILIVATELMGHGIGAAPWMS